MISVRSVSASEARIVVVRSAGEGDVDVVGQGGLQLRQLSRTPVDRVDDVGAGRAEQITSTAGWPLARPRLRRSSTESCTSATSDSSTGAAVAIGDDQRLVIGRMGRLVVGVDLVTVRPELDRALGRVGVGRRQGGAHVLQPDAVIEQACGLSSTRTAGRAAPLMMTWPMPLNCDRLLLQNRAGRIVHLAAGQRLRGQRQDQDRRVGRVDLAIGRVA